MTAQHAPGQSGVTLIETLLVVAISALLLIPLLGWGLLASREQVAIEVRNTDGASIGLLRTYVVRDVASARGAQAGTAAHGTDCSGGPGAAAEPQRTVLRLRGAGDAAVVYNLAASPDGGGWSVYRRECRGDTVAAVAEVAPDVAPSGLVATCSARPGAPSEDCGRVNLRVSTDAGELVSMSASLRTGAVSGPDAAPPTYVSPDVILSVSPVVVYRGEQVTFDASASSDPRGGELSYLWEFGDGTTSTDATVTRSYSQLGQFSAVLTATNADGTPASDYVRITVRNRPPTAVISAPSEGLVTHRCTNVSFAALGSNDSGDAAFGGSVASYHWSYGDGGTSVRTSSSAHTRQYTQLSPSGGSDPFTVRLRVVDNEGGESAEVTRSVRVVNRPPTVSITANGLSGSVAGTKPLTVNFASSASDPDGACDSLTYHWDFGNGVTSDQPNPTYTYGILSPPQLTARLRVTDDAGAQVWSNAITVDLNTAPVASFALGPNPVRAGVAVTVANTSSDAETPQAGLGHAWTFPNGAPGSSSSHAPGAVTFTHDVGAADTFVQATYVVSLTVTDPQGATNTTTRTITVQGAPAPTGVSHSGSSACTGGYFLGICRGWTHTNTVSWNTVPSVTNYQIHLRRSFTCFPDVWNTCYEDWFQTTGSTAGSHQFVNHPASGRTVAVRVRAMDAYTGKWGEWSAPITVGFAG